MNKQNVSDEYLNSFIDNQLDTGERMLAFDLINSDDSLKERVCDLRTLKELVAHAYSQPPGLLPAARKSPRLWTIRLQPLAASLLLLIGGVSGWLTHSWTTPDNPHDKSAFMQAMQTADSVAMDNRKIIIHVSNSSPLKFKTALDETESLLDTYKQAHRQIQLEFITNKHGVDLLRTSTSAYKNRISAMQEKYPNLNFMVCGQTINRMRANGENVQLLPHTSIATSAADQIHKRLNQGWGYMKI